jgi:hypothetical protein
MIALALALAAQGPAAAAPPDCLHEGEAITGELLWVETRRPGTKADLRFPVLMLPKIRCVSAGNAWSAGRWVQLALAKDEIKGLVAGTTLTIKGRYLVPPGGPLQIGDIIAVDVVIVSKTAS